MLIAQQKRKENIAEYILYIWQLEDMFRALQFSPEAIFSALVEKLTIDDEQKEATFFWYMEIVDLLRSENKAEHGHIEHTMHLIENLQELHASLLQLPSGEGYREVWAPLAAELPYLKERFEKQEISDVEFCMRALYSVVLYRIKGDQSRKSYQEDVITLISPVIAQLSKINREIEEGTFNLYQGTE